MGFIIAICLAIVKNDVTSVSPIYNAILQENGDFLLQENGDYLLQE